MAVADQARAGTNTKARRQVIRTLLGGGAAAALAGSTSVAHAEEVPVRRAIPTARAADDAFQPSGKVREYWIQAESFEHNAVPNGYDGMMGRHFTSAETSFWAVGFRAYTSDWSRPLDADLGVAGIGPNQGIPGPVLRGEVGDTIRVHFRNKDDHYQWPHSMHPHGVVYDVNNDGGWMADDAKRPGTAVAYGGTYTYSWVCYPSSVGTWPYHDHSVPESIPRTSASTTSSTGSGSATGTATPAPSSTHPAAPAGSGVMEIGAELGLFGVIAVTDAQTPEVDREFVLCLHDAYPSDIPMLEMHLNLFNGAAFVDNTPTYTAKVGDRVRWRIICLGRDFHVFHLHGHRWRAAEGDNGWVDSQILGPATTITVEYTEDNPGDWIYHCHVTDHMMGGMVGRYRVTS
jgi:FtsP/CotA-like multicopper oxidase with cupredoxin domain